MAEPTIRPICEADVKQIHEIEKACFAMPWSEASILHDVKENVVARWLVLDDGNGGVLAYAGMWFVLDLFWYSTDHTVQVHCIFLQQC